MDLTVACVLDARATLGEGAIWDASSGRLLWVDLHRFLVHRFDPVSGRDETCPVPTEPGTIVPTAGGGVVIAQADGVYSLNAQLGDLTILARVPHDPLAFLLNDGKCDPQGRLWVGSLERHVAPRASTLYRVDPDGTVTAMLDGVTISNGLGWSPDGGTMYYIDTPTQAIDAFDFDGATGRVSGRRTIVRIAEDAGGPDGMTVDAEGSLWVAMWDGGAVRRYRPDGVLEAVVEIGTPRVTSCAFGGPDLDELYVTTAAVGVESDLAKRSQAGGLFRLRPGVRGLRATPFGTLGDHGVTQPA